ncbi:MAG: GGDEF domain-containing protein [Aquificae bacterium]|nr:GGDEF domain-containing protein [Aquificota bacterium]
MLTQLTHEKLFLRELEHELELIALALKNLPSEEFTTERLRCAEELLKTEAAFLKSLKEKKTADAVVKSNCLFSLLGEGFKLFVKEAERLKKAKRELTVLLKEGEYERAAAVLSEYGRSLYALLTLLSLSEASQLELKLRRDPLTGLLSRKVLKPVFNRLAELTRVTDLPFTVALLDIDDFKKINDELGHPAGDCVLRKLARVVKSSVRKSDYAFRYGGEEFLLLLPSAGEKEARRVLERLRRRVEETTFLCGGKELKVTLSVGAVSTREPAGKLCRLVKEADRRLYAAKRGGKNRVEVGSI